MPLSHSLGLNDNSFDLWDLALPTARRGLNIGRSYVVLAFNAQVLYLEQSVVAIDNNRSERTIKPFEIGSEKSAILQHS